MTCNRTSDIPPPPSAQQLRLKITLTVKQGTFSTPIFANNTDPSQTDGRKTMLQKDILHLSHLKEQTQH